MACPCDDDLVSLLAGRSSRDVQDHVRECESCRKSLDRLSDDGELSQWKASLKLRLDQPVAFPDGLVGRILQDHSRLRDDDANDSETAHPSPLTIGSRLDSFEILHELGFGGMGIVYEARDVDLDRTVAIKLLPSDRSDAKFPSRAVREAQSAASVKHPNVVTVHAVKTAPDGSPYLVMEHVQGTTLREVIRHNGPLPPQFVAEVLIQAASGVDAVHEAGLIHRDIKPSNILLAMTELGRFADRESWPEAIIHASMEQWQAKITDFGLARLIADDSNLTQTALLAGTPGYMSPEQAQGSRQLDARSDVYSLGVSFYEALTGIVPFRGTPQMVLRQIELEEPRRPTLLNEAIPRDLETICLKAMAKEPSRRYATAATMAEDLRRWRRNEPITARPAGVVERFTRWCRRNPRVAVLTIAVFSLLVCLTVVSASAALWIASEKRKTEEQKTMAEEATKKAETNAGLFRQSQQEAWTAAHQVTLQRNLALEAHVQLIEGVQQKLVDTPGTLALRHELLESAVGRLQEVLAASEKSTDDRADQLIFHAKRRLGEAYQALGRNADAGREFDAALQIARTRYDATNQSVASEEDLAAALTSLGTYQLQSLDYPAALTTLEEARTHLDALTASQFNNPTATELHVRVLISLGEIAVRMGENSKGQELFQRALEVAEKLRQTTELTSQTRRYVESVWRRLGDAAILQGQIARGVDFYRKALLSAEQAGLADVSFAERQGLVDACGRLGLILTWLGEAEEAESYLRKGFELNDQALHMEPQNILLLRKSGILHQRFADVRWSQGRYDDMRMELLQARDLHRQAIAKDPAAVASQNDLVVCLEQLGRLDMRVEKYQAADEWYREGMEILEARKNAGTLTDPPSLGFYQTFPIYREILRYLPGALDNLDNVKGASPVVQAAVMGERAVVLARQGKISNAELELQRLKDAAAKLEPAVQSALALGTARIHSLCAQSLSEPSRELSPEQKQQLEKHRTAGVEQLQAFVAADPFNATHLRFDFELRALRDHPGFGELMAKFQGPPPEVPSQ